MSDQCDVCYHSPHVGRCSALSANSTRCMCPKRIPETEVQSPGKHLRITSRSWTDQEPDTFTVSLETDNIDGEAFVVVSGNATWLNPVQAFDAADYIRNLSHFAAMINQDQELRRERDDGVE